MPEPISATHRLRVSAADAHYGGGLVAGARLLELFGDLATELCIRSDGDEGLFAGYSNVEFLAPVRAGDFLEVRGSIVRAGRTSREMQFEVVRYAVARPDVSDSAADILDEPEPVARATGTCVVRQDRQRGSDLG
ncbi:MAG TPA: hotdog fold domain-containing protein [Actinomycetota bacterium]|nr:hotdog fold domain-containing protein [Actinomycetota bacterium]